MAHPIHEGRNIKRFREMLGIKQERLAYLLPGDDWTQKKISALESKEKIEPGILQEVSAALKIPVEAFQNFDEENAVNIIANTIHSSAVGIQHQPVLNPVDKWLEALDENKKLYDQLLQSEREKVALMREMLDRMK